MSLLENIRLAISGLAVNKMRALLTMLGIIIGIGSVIAITTLGDSLTGTITGQMASIGANNILVSLQERESAEMRGFGMSNMRVDESERITDDMLTSLMEAFPDEVAAIAVSQGAGSGKAQDGSRYANVSVSGVNPGYAPVNNVVMLEGRFITDRDLQGSRDIAVVSDKLAAKMFGSSGALEKEVRVNTGSQILSFTVVGVYEYQANALVVNMSSEEDMQTSLYIPVTTAQRLSGSGKGYASLTVAANPNLDPLIIADDVSRFLNRYYNDSSPYMVGATSMESILDSMTAILSTVQLGISAIAAISLLVGGIGVMNIMLVSVTERTREIGTRKALGARGSAIRIQFVVESVIICLIGGIIGILFGLLLGNIGSSLIGMPATASLSAIVTAVLFSMCIGIFFGYYPAGKAAKLDPIEALRYE